MEQPLFKVETQQYRFIAKSIKLSAFRGFPNEVVIPLEPDLTVFIAQNGGGKTTVLDALYEHLQILADATFQLEGHVASLAGKDVNLNVDTFGELSADFSLDYMAYEVEEVFDEEYIDEAGELEVEEKIEENEKAEIDKELLETETNEEEAKSIDATTQKIGYIEFLGNPLQTAFYINKESGIGGVSVDEMMTENHLGKIRSFNKLRLELKNIPTFKYYQPGEQRNKAIKEDFDTITSAIERWQKLAYQAGDSSKYKDRLIWLNEAISAILQDKEYKYSDFRVKYTERGDVLEITKQHRQSPDKYSFSIDQLSSGERALINMVADLAIRLIEKNPNYSQGGSPLIEGFGIVLIDEVDVHLHPEWQLWVVQHLTTIFPNIQFIVSTHSPLVLSSVTSSQVRYLVDRKLYGVDETYGRDASYIIKIIMQVANNFLATNVEKIGNLINRNSLDAAEKELKLLINEINDKGEDGENHPDVLRLNSLVTRKKVLGR